ncbi:DUF4919 domain-containing protein [Crocinitomix catalasitica]|uniref:DUF4919 domain-containing protein n=1 Tax=Crocinitomix catalasitica TaxID=184607 RepID=UPI00048892C1|nr:DUF4919 domain-containing protein [Crocinitomix catalasitica]
MKLSLFFLALTFNFIAFNQKVASVDFDDVKQRIYDSTSAYFYAHLYDRIVSGDTSINDKDYWYLYYGNVFQENYHPYGISTKKKEFNNFYTKIDQDSSKVAETILLGEQVLIENAVDIEVYLKMFLLLVSQNEIEQAKIYAKHYYGFLNVILSSGDGKAASSAFVVISVDDEYRVVGNLGLKVVEQSLINDCDLLTFSKKNQSRKSRIKQLYFNVRMPLLHYSSSYKNADLPEKE